MSSHKSRPTKKIDVFVGNLEPTTTESKLAAYVRSRAKPVRPAIAVHRVVMFAVKEGFDTSTARITIDARDLKLLLKRTFWPGRVYGRKWRYTDTKSTSPLEAKLKDGDRLAQNLLDDQDHDCSTLGKTTSHMDDESVGEQAVTLTSSLLAAAQHASGCTSTEQKTGECDMAASPGNNDLVADTSDTTSQSTSGLRELSVVVTRSNAKK